MAREDKQNRTGCPAIVLDIAESIIKILSCRSNFKLFGLSHLNYKVAQFFIALIVKFLFTASNLIKYSPAGQPLRSIRVDWSVISTFRRS